MRPMPPLSHPAVLLGSVSSGPGGKKTVPETHTTNSTAHRGRTHPLPVTVRQRLWNDLWKRLLAPPSASNGPSGNENAPQSHHAASGTPDEAEDSSLEPPAPRRRSSTRDSVDNAHEPFGAR
jgi:hypothetical protein